MYPQKADGFSIIYLLSTFEKMPAKKGTAKKQSLPDF
jgi:hypothetical protein